MRLRPIDGLLLAVMFIWGGNFSVVKLALAEVPPHAFNSLRLLLATTLFLVVLATRRVLGRSTSGPRPARHPPRLTLSEWAGVCGLGLVGHLAYQLFFIGGLGRTTAAHSALIIGSSPVVVAFLAAGLGFERVSGFHWLGAALSMLGVALVVGEGPSLAGGSLTGDLLVLGAVVCWAFYTVASRSLLERHSPLVVTTYSMVFGTAGYLVVGARELADLQWLHMTSWAWVALVFSAVFALFVAYLVWYSAVQQLGSARTSIYANLVPLTGAAIAVLWLGEPVRWLTLAGAAAVVGGVALTKIGSAISTTIPPEE